MSPRPVKLVIVGGSCSGVQAAKAARRLSPDASIVLLEPGPFVGYDRCRFPHELAESWEQVEQRLEAARQELVADDRVDVRTHHEVLWIDRDTRHLTYRNTQTEGRDLLPYDRLILNAVACPSEPAIVGLHESRVIRLAQPQDVRDAACRLADPSHRHVAVLGAGYTGLVLTETLRKQGLEVTVIEQNRRILPGLDPDLAVFLQDALVERGVRLCLHDTLERITATAGGLTLSLERAGPLDCDLLFLATGVQPDVFLAAQTDLVLGRQGGIAVNAHQQTSDPHIYAIGDAVEVVDAIGGFETLHPLAGPGVQQARVAVTHALGEEAVYRHPVISTWVRFFDISAGRTGLNEHELRQEQIPFESVVVHLPCPETSGPAETWDTVKLLFCPEDGTLLGGQVCTGPDGAAQLAALTAALNAGMTVFDLESFDGIEGPPGNGGREAVRQAGLLASEVVRGNLSAVHATSLLRPDARRLVVDLCGPRQSLAEDLPGTEVVTEQSFLARPAEQGAGRQVILICPTGGRAADWALRLGRSGHRCHWLSGGRRSLRAVLRSGPPARVSRPRDVPTTAH